MNLLVAVGDAPRNDAPPPGVAALLAAASEIRIMAPSLVGRLRWLTGDWDEARADADRRIADMVERIGDGARITTLRGDELTGTAFEDALRDFPADHVLLVGAKDNDLLARRHEAVEELLAARGVPVTIAFVD